MSDPESGPSIIGALFHAILFAYQKSVQKTMSKAVTTIVDDNISDFLDPVFLIPELKEVLKQTTQEKALTLFGEFLKSHYLVDDIVLTSKFNGHIFEVKNCMFGEEAHKIFDKEDVACPYGLIAHYIIEKVTNGKTIKSYAKFNEQDSITHIDFSEK